MSRMIIGLSGFIGSGKTTLGRHIVQVHGAIPTAFAAGVKQMAREVFDIDPAVKDAKNRAILVGIGNGMRALDPEVWVNYWRRHLPDEGLIVVDDVRFPNEVAAIEALGGKHYRIGIIDLEVWIARTCAQHGITRDELLTMGKDVSETALNNQYADTLVGVTAFELCTNFDKTWAAYKKIKARDAYKAALSPRVNTLLNALLPQYGTERSTVVINPPMTPSIAPTKQPNRPFDWEPPTVKRPYWVMEQQSNRN